MWCLLISKFGKLSKFFSEEILCLILYSSIKSNNSFVANANVMIDFFLFSHIVIMSDVKL